MKSCCWARWAIDWHVSHNATSGVGVGETLEIVIVDVCTQMQRFAISSSGLGLDVIVLGLVP